MGDDRNEPSVVISQSLAAADAETVDTGKRVASRPPGIRSRLLSLFRPSPAVTIAGCIAVLSAVAYLMAAPMGRDLSAQMAHAQLAESHWPAVLNLRWYGGFDPLGYSVLSPPVMALVGVRLTTALAYVASAVLFAALLQRPAVTRPVAGAIIGAVCLTGNLVTTRTTFALGLALGLGALLAVVSGRAWVASVLSVLAALSSPVAGLFLAVAGGALFLTGRRGGGVTLAVSALVPTVAIGLAFGNVGRQTFAERQALAGFWSVSRCGTVLAPSGCAVGCDVIGGLVAAAYLLPFLWGRPRHVCPNCSPHRLSPRSLQYLGCRHCHHRKRGVAATPGVHHRRARTG